MKYIISTFILAALMISCSGKTEKHAMKHDEKMPMQKAVAQADGEKLIYYTCPMETHKHIHSSEPGTCSECGMTLVEGVVTTADKMEYYGCPMEIHSHVRQDEPGRCAECKMELKPMRLKKS